MGDTNNKDMNQNGMDMEQIKEYGQAVLNNPKVRACFAAACGN